jgi:hypothetical protein
MAAKNLFIVHIVMTWCCIQYNILSSYRNALVLHRI